METATLSKAPDVGKGVDIITAVIIGFNNFIKICKTREARTYWFRSIFNWEQGKDLWKHLLAKYEGYLPDGFNDFYLNIDDGCQKALLNHCFNGRIDFTMPDIPDWQELREKYFSKNEDYKINFDQDDVRNYCVMFGDKTKWEVRPHSMVWITKALLFFNNNGIDWRSIYEKDEAADEEIKSALENYQGERFGNYPNWAAFWKQATPAVRFKIAERLLNYD